MRKVEVGGQAVIEGVMMRGAKGLAVAVRKENGDIEVNVENKIPITKRYKFLNIPFIRGVFALIDSMVEGIKCLNYSASFFEESAKPSKFEKWLNEKFGYKLDGFLMFFSVIISCIISIILFIAIPTSVASIFKRFGLGDIGLNIIEAIVRISILVIYMIIIGKFDDTRRIFEYHGAEHKTIFCYEADEDLTVENVRKFSRFHPRCGTNFLFLTMFISIVIFAFTGWGGFLERLILRIILVPLVAGISYEIIRWLGKNNNKLSNIISLPGIKLQNLTTKEPDDKQIEVAIKALKMAEGI